MSAVVAVVDGDRVLLGADSRDSQGQYCDESPTEKVTIEKLGDGTQVGFGFVGCPRVSQIARYCVDWATIEPPGEDALRWLIATVIPHLRAVLAQHESPLDEGRTGSMDGNMLVAVKGRMFTIHACWQVYERVGFTVIGVDDAAKGALHAMSVTGCVEPDRMVSIALDAAARWNTAVGPPYRFWTVT